MEDLPSLLISRITTVKMTILSKNTDLVKLKSLLTESEKITLRVIWKQKASNSQSNHEEKDAAGHI